MEEARDSLKTYSAPELKRWGSIKDLTLGSPQGKFDEGAGSKTPVNPD